MTENKPTTPYFKRIFTRFGQFLFLTISNFTKNAMWESASACAFGFIFSFIPITLIIFTVLVGLIRFYPSIYNFVLTVTDEINPIINIKPILSKVMEIRSLSSFNIFLGFWVIWMARKLFNSVIGSMSKIFRSVSKRKSWFNQIMTFIIEFLITLIIAVVIIVTFTFSQIISLPLFQQVIDQFPWLFAPSVHDLESFILYFVLFISTAMAYRVIPGTKPMRRRCIFYAILTTVSFFVLSHLMNKFMNVTNYNAVYGTISSLVLMMMKVYFFFILFLFFAQMIYVSQFFDPLLRSEIYQIAGIDSQGKSWNSIIKRALFINPSDIQTDSNTRFLAPGDILYNVDQKVNYIYFIKKGKITETSNRGIITHIKGQFLGDVQCILNEPYGATATAEEPCELITFTEEEFKEIVEKSHHAARKVLSKILNYTSEL